MNYDTILVTHHGPTSVVALNRPDKLNAMSMMLKAELVRALAELDKHEETRTIVLTGSGDKAFTAGGRIPSCQRPRRNEQGGPQQHWGLGAPGAHNGPPHPSGT